MIAVMVVSMSWAFAGAAFVFASTAACGPNSQERLGPLATVAESAPATPYAHATWMKLSDLVPLEADAGDVCVRLIVIDGEVLLRPYRNE